MKYSTTGAVAKNDTRAVENWLKARVLGEEVFSFMVTLRKDGDEDDEGKDGGEDEVVIGMMGSHHWPEVGYLLDPGMFESIPFELPLTFIVAHGGKALSEKPAIRF